MQLTIIGAVQMLVGLVLFLAGSFEAMFAFLLVSMLFGGSAAIVIGNITNGSSILPFDFALLFVALRVSVPGSGLFRSALRGVEANAWLAIFVIYGAVMAYAGPRLWAGHFAFPPLRGFPLIAYGDRLSSLIATRPFEPTTQNLTTVIYLAGTFFAAVAAHTVCKAPKGRQTLVRTMAVVGLIHCAFGVLSVIGRGTIIETGLGFFRNGYYEQVTQQIAGVPRMSGISPESSVFASFGAIWFVFLAECWLRRVETKLTGPAALVLGVVVFASTSATGYVGLAAYAGVLVLRTLLVPGSMPADRGLWLAGLVGIAVIGSAILLIMQPELVDRVSYIIHRVLIDKVNSESGVQRRFWAMQGWKAFVETWGVGVGPGSFRSSSLITAVLGCTGLVGLITLLAHILVAFKPLRWSTYVPMADPDLAVAGACAWAMLIAVIIGSVSSPSCDPGSDFAILTGAALALRGRSAVLVRPTSEPQRALAAA